MIQLSLQYVRAAGFNSGQIGYFGGGFYSHGDIVWPDGRLLGARSDRVTVNGIRYPRGVQFRPPGYAKWVRVTRIDIPCSLAQRNQALEWALTQVGKPYDYMAIVSFAFNRNWRTEGAWFCTEFLTRLLEIAFDFELPLTPNKINPGTSACVAGTARALMIKDTAS